VGDGGNGKVIRISPKTGHQRVVASGHGLDSPDSGAFTKGGDLVIADYSAAGGDGGVFRIDLKQHSVKALAKGPPFAGPTDAAITGNGDIYATDAFGGSDLQGAIYRIAHGDAHLVSDKGFFESGPLGLAAHGNDLFVADQDAGFAGSGALLSVNSKNGKQKILAQGKKLDDPYGLTLSPDGKYAYLADPTANRIVRVKTSTGRQHVVVSGGKLKGPTDVAYGLNHKLYVANDASNHPSIVKVNPKTGRASILAKDGFLSGPEGVTIQPRG
jgi:sugar lactone lactonase YvrE